MRKRTSYTLLVVFLILCALAAAIYLRQKAPPEVARLLPESDAIVYINLKPIRAATHFDRSPLPPAPAYQQFLDATGFVWERDLNQAAFALHRMPNPNGPNGPIAYSEVFEGHFDTDRLRGFLDSQAIDRETYANHIIYSIPVENRTLRVTLLDYDTVAASNMPTPEQIHSIIDRHGAAASPFAGSSLLSARYAEIPAFSAAWAIGRLGLPFAAQSAGNKITVGGLELPISADTTFIASLRYIPSLHLHGGAVLLQIDELTADQSSATQSAQALSGLLSVVRTLQKGQQPVDPALTQVLATVSIQPHKDRTTLTASIPPDLLKHLATPAQAPQ
jgi:hypothetical protein